MKQDKFEHIVKESLESMNPEVPENLWENIRTQIPSAPSAETTGVEQGGSAASGTGTAGLLKVGAAAVALFGGGSLVWYLNTTESVDVKENSGDVTQHVGQQEPVGEEQSDTYQLDVAPEKGNSENAAVSNSEGTNDIKQQLSETQATPHEKSADPATINDEKPTSQLESSDAESAQIENEVIDGAMDEKSTGENAGSEAVKKSITPSQEQIAEDSESKEQDDTYHSQSIVMVECGILANKVSGESPLAVKFSNVTKASSFEWDFGNGRKSYDPEPMTTFDEAGDYTVDLTVTDFDGNRLTDQMEISVFERSTFFAPNAFSPNGDGLNDYFMVEGTNITDVSFEIFRLDGSLVYEGTGIRAKWDGSDSQQSGDSQYLVVTKFVRNDGTPDVDKTMLSVIRD